MPAHQRELIQETKWFPKLPLTGERAQEGKATYSERVANLGKNYWQNERDVAFDETTDQEIGRLKTFLERSEGNPRNPERSLLPSYLQKLAGVVTSSYSSSSSPEAARAGQEDHAFSFLHLLQQTTHPHFERDLRQDHPDWLLRFFLGSEHVNKNYYRQKMRTQYDMQEEMLPDHKAPGGEDVDYVVMFEDEEDFLDKLPKLESILFQHGFACTFVDEVVAPYYAKKNHHWKVAHGRAFQSNLFTLFASTPDPTIKVGRPLREPTDSRLEIPEEEVADVRQVMQDDVGKEEEQGGRASSTSSTSDSKSSTASSSLSQMEDNIKDEINHVEVEQEEGQQEQHDVDPYHHKHFRDTLTMRLMRPSGRRWDSILEGLAGYDAIGCKRVPTSYAVQHSWTSLEAEGASTSGSTSEHAPATTPSSIYDDPTSTSTS
ncbi:unnamed protein product, partial [Amoebophrya sp. A25]|eukprot:GSA25T00018536001.1